MPSFVVAGAFSADPNRVLLPALTVWSRLEPVPFTADLLDSLQAAIADPAWLLARQWQYGELQGEDAGSPVTVQVEGEQGMLSRYAPGALRPGVAPAAVDYDPVRLPPEVLVERESARAAHRRFAIDAACQLLRMLQAAGAPAVAEAFRTAFRLTIPAVEDAEVDREAAAWTSFLDADIPDARAIATALSALRRPDGTLSGLPGAVHASPADGAKALPILQRWLAGYVDATSDGEAAAWSPPRQEYAFAMSAQMSGGEVVLVSDEYTNGRIDWHTFRAVGGVSLGKPATPRPATNLALRPMLPAPVEYPGKPADRFWEFEDGAVSFGAVDASVTDLTRMLLVEFALVYGNDWFVVPLELPIGSLFRIGRFTVRDAFGVESQVGPSRNSSGTPWTMWMLSAAADAPASIRDLFFLAPALGVTLEGEPVEKVALVRDEMANMAWGIEHRIAGLMGNALERSRETGRPAASQALGGGAIDASIAYRLATIVPEYWIPLVPVPALGTTVANFSTQLERRAMIRQLADGTNALVHPRGLLLRSNPALAPDAEPPLRIEDEEVPREGALVERSYQYARWLDGTSFVWLGRRKVVGRGEGSSGLRYDRVERVVPTSP
jgi:hypothetical protein